MRAYRRHFSNRLSPSPIWNDPVASASRSPHRTSFHCLVLRIPDPKPHGFPNSKRINSRRTIDEIRQRTRIHAVCQFHCYRSSVLRSRQRHEEDSQETGGFQAHEEERNQGKGVHPESQIVSGAAGGADATAASHHGRSQRRLDYLCCRGGCVPLLAQSTATRKRRRKALFAESGKGCSRLLCFDRDPHRSASSNAFPAFSRTVHRRIRGAHFVCSMAGEETLPIHAEGDETDGHIERFERRKVRPGKAHIDHVWPFSRAGATLPIIFG